MLVGWFPQAGAGFPQVVPTFSTGWVGCRLRSLLGWGGWGSSPPDLLTSCDTSHPVTLVTCQPGAGTGASWSKQGLAAVNVSGQEAGAGAV